MFSTTDESFGRLFPQVLLGHEDGITIVDTESATQVAVSSGSIKHIAVSPHGQLTAAFTEDGRVVVWLADFTKNLLEFSTGSHTPPSALAWCGTESVVVVWQVSFHEYQLLFESTTALSIVSEVCSIRSSESRLLVTARSLHVLDEHMHRLILAA